jgi:uncharacterized repeat protein (TIGR04138 family)
MAEPELSIVELLRQDRRFKPEAYYFVFNALSYGHKVLGMGTPHAVDRPPVPSPGEKEAEEGTERHLTGQELCEAIRRYALEEYGYMAKCVLNSWGVTSTGDFGEIVFNLIRVGEMRKTDQDRREDFNDVYDFDTALETGFRIELPSENEPG